MTVAEGAVSDDAVVDLWSLRSDVFVESVAGEDALVVHSAGEQVRITAPSAAVRDALRRMTLGPVTLDNVGLDFRTHLPALLTPLGHLVVRSTGEAGHSPTLSVHALHRRSPFRPRTVPEQAVLRLSGDAVVYRDGDDFVVEVARHGMQVRLHNESAMWVLAPLGRGSTLAALESTVALPAELTRAVTGYLLGAHAIEVCGHAPGTSRIGRSWE